MIRRQEDTTYSLFIHNKLGSDQIKEGENLKGKGSLRQGLQMS